MQGFKEVDWKHLRDMSNAFDSLDVLKDGNVSPSSFISRCLHDLSPKVSFRSPGVPLFPVPGTRSKEGAGASLESISMR